jgi:hypothetical protein
MKRKTGALLALIMLAAVSAFAEDEPLYRIAGVNYSIKGQTLEYALSQQVEIDRTTVFFGKQSIDEYIAYITTQLKNQRVFESVFVNATYSAAGTDGVIPVTLAIDAVDTWNLVVVPYPKYDSNSGFMFKLKLKDFNFFGSMQPLTFDVIYQNDENFVTHFGSNIDFKIPFMALDHAMVWNVSSSFDFPLNSVPSFAVSTGLECLFPVFAANKLHVGFTQGYSINKRDGNENLYIGDEHFATETLYANLPVLLATFDKIGKLYWTPSATVSGNVAWDGIQNDDLKGPDATLSNALSVGQVDWIGNFRKGANISLSNSWNWDFSANELAPKITLTAQEYTPLGDVAGIYAQLTGFTYLDGSTTNTVGATLRGIRDTRIDTDTAITLNVDLPVKVLYLDFSKIDALKWARILSFEMHLSPFFDMALTHDPKNGRYYALSDGWYAGGLEMIVYPLKMRSLYARASMGFDIPELINNNFDIGGKAVRDGASIYDIFIGIGLLY